MLLLVISQVVYLSESAAYLPVTPIRSRHPQAQPPPTLQEYQAYGGGLTGGGEGAASGGELEQWRPELWDRDYSRRYRRNNTRVQRKWVMGVGN